jgi:hypothetical protein
MFKTIAQALTLAALALVAQAGFAYGEEGHSIVAEIAQRRLDPVAQAAVTRVLGGSMASVASWPDEIRSARPETTNWHFVDIPMASGRYEPARDCVATGKGDCIVAELERLRTELLCAPTATDRREALMFAIHFLGDIHQPLHAVGEKLGGNGQPIAGVIQGPACSRNGCDVKQLSHNLHAFWDTGLIRASYYAWGSYVDKLEAGALKDPAVLALGESTDIVGWAEQSHAIAQQVWDLKAPLDANGEFIIDDAYYRMAMPLLDKELAVAGLRLAKFLNQAYAGGSCRSAPNSSVGDPKAEPKR